MLGKRLKALRGKRTQEEIAEHLGISRARYSHYENGRSEPDIETLKQLALFYGVSTDYLINETENRETSTVKVAGQEIVLSEEEYRVFQEMKKHPSFPEMLKDLSSDPERKVKKLIKMWELIKPEGE